MANSAQIKSGLDTLMQSHLSRTLRQTLFNKMPLLYFMLGRDGQQATGAQGLGRPKVNNPSAGYGGVFVSGMNTAKAKKNAILSGRVYEPIVQTSGPNINDGKVLGQRDNMPTRSSWETKSPATYTQRPRVKWVERAEPYEIPNKDIRATRAAAKDEIDAWAAIGSLFQLETETVVATHEKWWNQRIFGTGTLGDGVTANTGLPTSEDAEVWDNLHSIDQMVHDSNTYCGVDRSLAANSYWRGNRVTTATVADFEAIINFCNVDLHMSDKGMGVDLMIVGGANWKKAKAEAKSKQNLFIAAGKGVPEFGEFGFQKEVVKIDNTWIIYDPEQAAATVYALNLSTFTFAIHPDSNFRVSAPVDYTKTTKGGDDSTGGTIRTEMMFCCEVPSMNAVFTNVS